MIVKVDILSLNTKTAKQEKVGTISFANGRLSGPGSSRELAAILSMSEMMTADGTVVDQKADPERWLRSLEMNLTGSYLRATEAYNA